MTLLFAINTGWRLFALPMWGDEVRTWRDSVGGRSYDEILRWVHNKDHAPLGHLLTKASADLFGTDAPWALRLPSYLFGLVCVPLGYLLGRSVWNSRAGVLMAVMIAVDVTLTQQAQLSRMYTMLMAFMLAALCAAAWTLRSNARLERKPEDAQQPLRSRVLQALAMGLALAGALWSHFAATSIVLAVLLMGVILLFKPSSRSAGVVFLAGVFLALAAASQGLIKLASMAGREKLPYDKDRDALEQLLLACQTLIGNSPLAILLFGIAMYGLFLIATCRRSLGTLLMLMTGLMLVNLFIAANYRHIEGARYLLGFLPVAWLGLAVVNDVLWQDRRLWLAQGCMALFVAGVAFQFSRNIVPAIHPQAYFLRETAAVLPSLGYSPDQALIFAPVEPQRTSALYYRLPQNSDLQKRIYDAWRAKNVSRNTLRRGRPEVLWVIAVTPSRERQEGTVNDGFGQADAAARCYGHVLDRHRLPTKWEERQISILKITPTSLDIWSPNGTPR
ncbi:MAG TPA: phospholipid carrier-dependent glycosyltransferase [Tepidisphaeraceae bacterium]